MSGQDEEVATLRAQSRQLVSQAETLRARLIEARAEIERLTQLLLEAEDAPDRPNQTMTRNQWLSCLFGKRPHS